MISDPKNPENEGKVFLFKYGKKIFDKITMLMNPEFEGDKPVNPFDFWKGANFKLRIRTVDGYPNYDQSIFEGSAALSDDDGELEAIWKKQYSLKEFTDPKNFKSYDELKKKLDEVLGVSGDFSPAPKAEPRPMASEKPVFNKPKTAAEETAPFDVDDEDDEELAAFKKLAM